MGLLDSIRDFCKTTSVKGLPKVVRSDSTFLRFLWSIAMILFMSMCVYQLWLLMGSYLDYRFVTSFTPVEMTFTNKKSKGYVEMPQFIACPDPPLYTDSATDYPESVPVMPDDYITQTAYNEKVTEVIQNETTSCGNNTKCLSEIQQLERKLVTPMGYFQTIGKKAASMVGHRKDTFIKTCSLYKWDGQNTSPFPCDENINISMVHNPVNYNCYMFTVNNPRNILGISITFFVNNLLSLSRAFGTKNSGVQYIPHTKYGQTTGVIFDILEPGRLPSHNQLGFKFTPGTKNEVSFKMTKTLTLTPPHGKCDKTNINLKYQIGGNTYRYTEDACYIRCLSDYIVKYCHCIPVVLGEAVHDAREGLPYCENINYGQKYSNKLFPNETVNDTQLKTVDNDESDEENITDNRTHYIHEQEMRGSHLLQHQTCMAGVSAEYGSQCRAECRPRCESMTYKSTVHTTQWPQIEYHNDFYVQMVRGQPYENRFLFYERAYRNMYSAGQNGDRLDVAESMARAKMIYDNFVKISCFISDTSISFIEDSPYLSTMSLISQLGAIANLWAGITVVLIVEIIEFLYKLLFQGVETVQNRETPAAREKVPLDRY